MNFNVYIDDETGKRLRRLAKARRMPRNALIREALTAAVEQAGVADWPRAVLEFRGVPKFARFERARRGLRAPRRDPLA